MSHSNNKPKIISQNMIVALLRKPDFFEKLPEFRSLQNYLKRVEELSKTGKGCRSCKKRRAQYNLLAAFIQIVGQLNQEAVQRLKTAVGADRLMYHGFNKHKGNYELREL